MSETANGRDALADYLLGQAEFEPIYRAYADEADRHAWPEAFPAADRIAAVTVVTAFLELPEDALARLLEARSAQRHHRYPFADRRST